MYALRRKAGQSACQLGRAPCQLSRRYASDHHDPKDQKDQGSGHHDHHDHGHDAHHSEPVNEPLGKGFYIMLAAIPFSIAVYAVSRPSEDGKIHFVTRMMEKYSDYQEKWHDRNRLHTAMIEQAAYDRHLFQGQPGNTVVTLRFSEVFNTGSPFNIAPGQHARGLDKVVDHYQRQNVEQQDRAFKRLEKEMKEKERVIQEQGSSH